MDLYSAFRSEDTKVLDAAHEDEFEWIEFCLSIHHVCCCVKTA